MNAKAENSLPNRVGVAGKIWVGCCGFALPRRDYYTRFPVVEIQQSFYRMPSLEVARRWRREAPAGFQFTMKAWQLITHDADSPTYRRLGRKLAEEEKQAYGSFRWTPQVQEAWRLTRQFALALGVRYLLFQCPPRFTPTEANMERMRCFFGEVQRDPLRFVWEPRGNWKEDQVRRLCRELDLIHAVDPFRGQPLWGEVRYFRLHGPAGYSSRYGEARLEELRERLEESKESFLLFNHRWMVEEALLFQRLLSRA